MEDGLGIRALDVLEEGRIGRTAAVVEGEEDDASPRRQRSCKSVNTGVLSWRNRRSIVPCTCAPLSM